jgi:arylsulfatase
MSDRPNILHIFCDQLRFDALACAGNPVIRTPNIDRLAADGVVFTNAFSPSPVCVSARCSMIHGQYPMNTGCYENTRMPTDGRQTFMQVLTEAGYRTHGIGKCHFMPDANALRGFQTRERQEEGGKPAADDEYVRWLVDNDVTTMLEPHGVRGEMYYVPQPSQLPARYHPTQWIGDRSVDFITNPEAGGERRAPDQPWYLFASFIDPHPPFAPPSPWHKLYRAVDMPLPKVPADWESLLVWINRFQNRYKYRDQGIDQNFLRCMKAYYYATVSFIDYQVGRMLDALESTGRLNDSLIVLTADHGEHLGDYNCFGKRSMHDTAARIPMIARQPGVFGGGARVDTPTSLVDLAPTFLSAAGADLTSHPLDGVPLQEVAAGSTGRDTVYSQLMNGDAALHMAVTREWKYVYSAPDQRELLFDRTLDPEETRDRFGTPFAKEAAATMKERLFAQLRAGGETDGIEGDGWKRFPKKSMPDNPDAGLLIQDGYVDDRSAEIPGYTTP